MSGVEGCTDVRDFFRDHVTEALKSLAVRTEQATEHYLVNLLAGFAVSDRIHEMCTPFVELANRFGAFARVLDEVREQTAMCTDGEILRIYERWSTTRSPELFRRLNRRGVGPVLGSNGSNESN